MGAAEEQLLFDQVSADAKRLLVYHGIDGFGEQGAYVNATIGQLKLHCHARRGLHIRLGNGKGKYALVYAEDNLGVCNARYMPLVVEVMQLMRTALVLDDLANA